MLAVTWANVVSPSIPSSFDGVRAALVSDLHFSTVGPQFQDLLDALKRETPDLLLISGDITHKPARWRAATEFLGEMIDVAKWPMGAFAVLGNHDSWRLRSYWDDRRLRFLKNESCLIRRGAHAIRVLGVEQFTEFSGDLPTAVGPEDRSQFTILLAHYPSSVLWARYISVDLVLSGHTHGGQIRVPGIGAIHTSSATGRRFCSGIHRVDGSLLYVGRGIGFSGMFRTRIFCRPELPIITLRRGPELAFDVVATTDRANGCFMDRARRWVGWSTQPHAAVANRRSSNGSRSGTRRSSDGHPSLRRSDQ
jgi:hypothetical protein